MFQRIVDTAFSRYPEVFSALRARVAERKGAGLGGGSLRILSFGCSAGLEMQSMRCYFPDAALLGCDVDVEMLSRARQAMRGDSNAQVFLSTPKNIAVFGPYDVVLALSVLCRYPRSRKASNLDAIFPYSLFESLLGDIDQVLAPDGLIAIHNSNYLFSSLPWAGGYRPVRTPLIASNGFVDRFAQDGHRLTVDCRLGKLQGQEVVDRSGAIREDDLRDSIFERRSADTPATPIEMAAGEAIDPACMCPMPGGKGGAHRWPNAAPGLIYPRLDSRLYASPTGAAWVRREWILTRLDQSEQGLGAWWTRATREEALGLSGDQTRVIAELRRATSRAGVLKARALRGLKMPFERRGAADRRQKKPSP